VKTKLGVSTLLAVLSLTSCASSKAEAELDSALSKQELAWGHVVEACRMNAELNATGFFATEAALSEMKKAAALDPIYIEYVTAHLFTKRVAESGTIVDFDLTISEYLLQGSKVDALCLTANQE
jgi:hypothetical protein